MKTVWDTYTSVFIFYRRFHLIGSVVFMEVIGIVLAIVLLLQKMKMCIDDAQNILRQYLPMVDSLRYLVISFSSNILNIIFFIK